MRSPTSFLDHHHPMHHHPALQQTPKTSPRMARPKDYSCVLPSHGSPPQTSSTYFHALSLSLGVHALSSLSLGAPVLSISELTLRPLSSLPRRSHSLVASSKTTTYTDQYHPQPGRRSTRNPRRTSGTSIQGGLHTTPTYSTDSGIFGQATSPNPS